MKAKELKSRIGQQAQIKILKAKKSSYWYAKNIGKKFFATLVKERVFTDKKTFEWKVVDNTSVSGYSWINFKDAEVISWYGRNYKKPSNKFNPIAVGFTKVERGYQDEIYVRYEIADGKKRIKDWIVYPYWFLPRLWWAYKVKYHADGSGSTESMVFQGKIPNNSFAKQLFKNIF